VAALGIEIVEATEGAAVEEAVAQIANAALDLAFRSGSIRPAALTSKP
jgi:hypothetical protein